MTAIDPVFNLLLKNPQQTLAALDRADGTQSLKLFTKRLWPILEPHTPFVEGWALDAICEHLEAVTDGDITRLLINVPPGFMKSLLTNVFWPAWEWSSQGLAHHRFVTFSYSASLTERDNRRFLDLQRHPLFQALWGGSYKLRKEGETLVSNDKTGWKLASSVGGVGTGERGDRVLLDDPHNVKESESDQVRGETVRWFREAMSNRLNNMETSAIIVIMQRVHEADVSGAILDSGSDYTHLMVPMEYDGRRYTTSIGWTDPRSEDGELAWPERFSAKVVADIKIVGGEYAYAGQYQQIPSPRGGGIFKVDWWQPWDTAAARENGCLMVKTRKNPLTGEVTQVRDAAGNPVMTETFPPCEYVVASLDTAYTEKEENDYSALTVWGVWRDLNDLPRVMLMAAWRDRLTLHDLVEKSAATCKRFKVDRLLIEAKASGISVAQELRRLYSGEGFAIQDVDPKGADKVARAYAVQPLFSDGMVFAPFARMGDSIYPREWVDMVIREMASFPRAPHDDLVDSATQALKHLRVTGIARHGVEIQQDLTSAMTHTSQRDRPLYPTG